MSRAPRLAGGPRCDLSRGGLVWLAFAAMASSPAASWAGSPEVRFDAPLLVACRDITTESFAASNPQLRLIEARVPITALPVVGETRLPLQYTYRFLYPTGTIQVMDYQPRTAQSTQLVGNITVERKQDKNKSLGLTLSGSFQQLVQGSSQADLGQKQSEQIRYELKPPLDVTLVSGTLQRGTGVYFQLLPAPDSVWEGSHEFVMVLCVPHDWRGDLLYLRCDAQLTTAGPVTPRGVARFVVGLCAEGDLEARTAAQELQEAEMALRRTGAQRQRAIERGAVPSVIHRVGTWLDVYEPRIPAGWLERVVYGPARLEDYDFVDYLPEDVRRAAERYMRAKRRLQQYSGGSVSRVAQRDERLAIDTRRE